MYILDKEHYCWTIDDTCGEPQDTIKDAIQDFYEDDCQNLDCLTVDIGHPSYYIPDMFNAEQLIWDMNDKIEMIQTPAGYVKVGDVIGYDRSNKRIRFGTITKLNKDGVIWLTHSYCVVFGDDGKQAIYQSMDGSIEHYRVCKVL